jgi:hypothetical protein
VPKIPDDHYEYLIQQAMAQTDEQILAITSQFNLLNLFRLFGVHILAGVNSSNTYRFCFPSTIPKEPVRMSVISQGLSLSDERSKQVRSHVKRVYVSLALRFHPDKNPTGLEMFKKIHSFYEAIDFNS